MPLVLVKQDVRAIVPDGVDEEGNPKTRIAKFFCAGSPSGRIYDVPEGTRFLDKERVGKVSAADEKAFRDVRAASEAAAVAAAAE